MSLSTSAYSTTGGVQARAADDSLEDNDTIASLLANANSRSRLTLANGVTKELRNLSLNDAADFYAIQVGSLKTGGYVKLASSKGLSSLRLGLYDADGTLVVSAAAGANSISLSGLDIGTYYIGVTGVAGATGVAYALDVNSGMNVKDDRFELYDSPSALQNRSPEAADSPNFGVLSGVRVEDGLSLRFSSSKTEHDGYAFKLNSAGAAGDYLEVDLVKSSLESGDNVYVTLYQNNQVVASVSSAKVGTALSLSLEGLTAGNYVVDVMGVSNTVSNKRSVKYDMTVSAGAATSSGSTNNYAVIFMGGYDTSNNYSRYYYNAKDLYKVLTGVYGLAADHIYLLYADGTDPAIDQNTSDSWGRGSVNSDMSFASGSHIYEGTKSNLTNVMTTLGGKLGSSDYFLFYSFDHGGRDNDTGVTTITGYGEGNDITASEFNVLASKVNAGHETYVFTECFSGGILDALTIDSSREYACAATSSYEPSYTNTLGGNNFSGFAQAATTALNKRVNTTYSLFSYAKANDPFAYKRTYDTTKNASATQVYDGAEHPWYKGGNITIFDTSTKSSSSNTASTGVKQNSYSASNMTFVASNSAEGFYVNSSVTFTMTGSGYASFSLYLDGDADGKASSGELLGQAVKTGSSWTYTLDTAAFTAGTYCIIGIAKNAANAGTKQGALNITVKSEAEHKPFIASVSSALNGVAALGEDVVLTTVFSGAGTTAKTVSYYLDANGNSVADSNELLGSVSNASANNWSYVWNDSGYAAGTYSILAVASDAGNYSDVASYSLKLAARSATDSAPVISRFTSETATELSLGDLAVLSVGVSDPDVVDAISSVKFYRDANNNGKADKGEFLGSDDYGADGWSYSYAVSGAPGTQTILAVAEDYYGTTSQASLALTVHAKVAPTAPVISSFTASFQAASSSFLFSVSATDRNWDDSVSKVAIYLDLDKDGQGYVSTEFIGDATSTDGKNWTLTWNVPAEFDPGTYKALAYAYDGTDRYSVKALSLTAPLALAEKIALDASGTGHASSDFVSSSDKSDFYQFTVSGPGSFTLSLTGDNAYASMKLYSLVNGKQTQLSAVRLNSGDVATLSGQLLQQGTYYVAVSSTASQVATTYSLDIHGTYFPTDSGLDNKASTTDKSLALGSTGDGWVGFADAYDFFKFAGGGSAAKLDFSTADAGAKLLVFSSADKGATLKKVAGVDLASAGSKSLTLKSLASGDYYFEVLSLDAKGATAKYNTAYHLSVSSVV